VARIYVARHGETDWNREARYQGQLESRLTELGLRQAEALAAALAGARIERVLSSPLARCRDTAEAIARKTGARVEIDPLLLEIAHGSWEGRLRGDIERDDPARMHAWRTAPSTVRFEGGESLAEVGERWRRFAASIAGGRNTVAVTHDVIVRLAILWASRRPEGDLWEPRVRNGGYAAFETSGSAWEVLDECCESHLAGLFSEEARQAL